MGRPLGVANKNKDFLLDKLKKMYGEDFDPIMKMAENANSMQKIATEFAEAVDKDGEKDHEVRAKEFGARIKCTEAWDRVAQYTQPKLKAIEISGDLATYELSDEERAELIATILDKARKRRAEQSSE